MALATADIHVKIDPMVKKKAERKFKAAGITMSDFINIELRKVVRGDRKVEKVIDEALPENLRIESEEQLKRLLEKRIEKDGGKYYTSEEMWAILDKHRKELKERSKHEKIQNRVYA